MAALLGGFPRPRLGAREEAGGAEGFFRENFLDSADHLMKKARPPMKTVSFFAASVLALLCVILSFISFRSAIGNNALQTELLMKQTEIQEVTQALALQNEEFNRQSQTIETGATVAQKLGPPILRDMGYLAMKNKNDKFKKLLLQQRLEAFIPTDEQVKQIDEMRAKQAGQPAAAGNP